MSRQLARSVLSQMHMRPALIAPRYAEASAGPSEVTSLGLMGDILELAAMPALSGPTQERVEAARRRDLLMAYGYGGESPQSKPFAFAEGKAIIPIHGLLVNRFLGSYGFLTGYTFIRAQVEAAMGDEEVDGIIYDVNSNGGTVAGCRETSDIIWSASKAQGGKPSLAVVDANCFSAAYMLASGADSIAITPTGGAGSIGVLLMHMDMSAALDKFGIKVTFIKAGDHKVDGNPYEPLSKEVTADLQAEVDKMYDGFVATVARNRPGLSEQGIRDTQARCYQADDALRLGLVDSVQIPSAALETFFGADPGGDNSVEPEQEGTSAMPTETKPAAPAASAAPAADAPDPVAAATAARNAERERVKGIQTHAEAEGRSKLAEHLALETDLTVEAAAGILKASPKQSAAPAPTGEANHFKQAMDAGTHPNVGAGAEGTSATGEAKQTRAQEILGAQRRMMGTKQTAPAA